MKEIRTEIEIKAKPERVWQVLTDFDSFSEWNPFIQKINGRIEVGSKLEIQILTPGGKNRIYKPTVTKVEPNHELRWAGKAFVRGIFDGERIFIIEQVVDTNSSRFIHIETFSGIGSSLAGNRMEKDIQYSLEEMNNALKKRVEQGSR